MEDRAADALFTIDDEAAKSQAKEAKAKAKPLTRKERARAKTLKVYEITAPSVHTKAVSVMKRKQEKGGQAALRCASCAGVAEGSRAVLHRSWFRPCTTGTVG